MSIVGDHPEGGIRFDLDRMTAEPPWSYCGAAFTRDSMFSLRIHVDAAGAVVVEDESALPAEVVRRAKLLIRSVCKPGKEAAGHSVPPNRIRRWRAD
jgi:hypothetical protein